MATYSIMVGEVITMENISREEAWEIVKEHLASSDIYQKEIGIMLGLEKYDVSKVLHGKRKLYLHEFLMLANALNLTSPAKEKTYLQKIEELEKEIESLKEKKKELNDSLKKYKTSTKENEDKVEELTSKVILYSDAYERVDKYLENSKLDVDELSDIFERLEKALKEGSMFSPASYIEYEKLKRNKYFLENQYVFNLSDLLKGNGSDA